MTTPITARSSSAVIPHDPEEARAFLQQRLALLGKLGTLLSGAGLTLSIAIMLANGVPLAQLAERTALALNLVMCASVGAVWLLCGRRLKLALSFPVLHALDAGLTISGITLSAITVLSIRDAPGAWVLPILGFAQVIFIRTVILPSTARRTLVVSSVSAIPIVICVHFIVQSIELPPGMSRLGFPAMAGIWCAAAVASSTVCSRVIYGLRERASEAMALGQYTLVEKIGEGGMGIVYRAKHAFLRRPTAVKLLSAEKAGPRDLARFEREVQLTSQLSHPNTIAIYDYGHTPAGVFYYAMEYLDGLSLEDLVAKYGALPPTRVIHILAQVAGALREAHGAGLIHRDIKPANIVLCERGGVPDTVKVLDFGLVKELRGSEEAGVTLSDMAMGTPYYMAPEAIREPEKVDGRTDLYALGAVGYFLLTGKVVFEGKTVIDICGHHLHSKPVPPSKRAPGPLPDDLEAIILRCLAKEPGERFGSAAELGRALSACSDAGGWSEDEARAFWASPERAAHKATSRAREQVFAETLPALTVNVRERLEAKA